MVSAQRPNEFLLSQLPPLPARVLEIGCGQGELARALAERGYEVTAIDPTAPRGAMFRNVTLEEFAEPGPFDAVVAQIALHHVGDLRAALGKIARLLDPHGVLVLDEFAHDRLDGATARWYYDQRQAVEPLGAEFEHWLREWREAHGDLHSSEELRRELDHRFTERLFAWVPYLYRYRLDQALEPLERRLIETGAIQATGFRYVGVRRS